MISETAADKSSSELDEIALHWTIPEYLAIQMIDAAVGTQLQTRAGPNY